MIGSTLSHYRIEDELGRGGMGIVYRAEDTRLDRTVAIKVLPSAALASKDDRERFYREAKSAAQLHHPHIASVFEIDEAVPSDAPHGTQPSPFIAMEFIDGKALRDEVQKGPMDLRRCVQTTIQVADALKAAHAKNIVHRDIKSQNVMLTRDGDAKVLDFGLAKTAQSTMLTRLGSTLGTVAYMSPEQARGEEVDHRTDIWSLGIMLYEMIAGRLPFAGEYEKAVMYGILNEMPAPLTSVRTGVPMGLEWIVTKMLAKDPAERYQSCADLIVDLKTVDLSATGLTRTSATTVSSAATPAASAASSGRRFAPTWLFLLLLPLGVGLGWLLFYQDQAEPFYPAPKRFVLEVEGLGRLGGFTTSHDGSFLLGSGGSPAGLGLHRVDLRTGEFSHLGTASSLPFLELSYDDEWVAFQSGDVLQKIRLAGGAPMTVFEEPHSGFTWLPDGSLLVVRADSTGNELLQFPASGGEVRVVVKGQEAYRQISGPVSFGRDDRIFMAARPDQGAVWTIVMVDIGSGEITPLTDGIPVEYSTSRHLLYLDNSSTLMARAFDPEQAEFLGPSGIVDEGFNPWLFAIDPNGVYYSVRMVNSDGAFGSTLRVLDGETREVGRSIELSLTSAQPRISPDGQHVIVRHNVESGSQILKEYNLETGIARQFTIESEGDADNAAYSPDGSTIIYESNNMLFRRNRNRSGSIEEIETPAGTGALDWSPDGRFVVFLSANVDGYSELFLLELESGAIRELDAGPGRHGWPRFSPDGRFVSYGTQNTEGVSIWVMGIEDGSLHLVSERLPTYQTNRHPMSAWTADGNWLSFQSH
ncbi:MAG: protein kinase, partial [Bacteroidetes bacterium]|nr:protein kinase [Bacteroidota bacterium]